MSQDTVAHDDWYPVAIAQHLVPGQCNHVTLMEHRLTVVRRPDGSLAVEDERGAAKPVCEAHGHVWSSLGQPAHPVFAIPEGLEAGRTLVDCGGVRVRASPLRVVENFLDIAHFPFVHTDILGAEPHTEVAPYRVEIRDTVDEVWATKVSFYQPQAAKSASDGIVTEYEYRVPAPCASILYKTCPPRPGEMDVIALFVRPLSETLSEAYAWMALYDDDSSIEDLIQFQQTIFLQDRSILENQVPRKLPLDPRMESPTGADKTSIAYRRWLKRKGFRYGAEPRGV
ncbi:MAG: aromatic ring-hydroxylating dioxygenase subunit alpha [Pseudomonadota bacterium]